MARDCNFPYQTSKYHNRKSVGNSEDAHSPYLISVLFGEGRPARRCCDDPSSSRPACISRDCVFMEPTRPIGDDADDLHALLMNVQLWHLFGPLRQAGETLASLQARLDSQGRASLIRRRQIKVWSFSGDRKVSLPLQKLRRWQPSSRDVRRELPTAGLNPSQSDKQLLLPTSPCPSKRTQRTCNYCETWHRLMPQAIFSIRIARKANLADFEEMVDATNLSERGSALRHRHNRFASSCGEITA